MKAVIVSFLALSLGACAVPATGPEPKQIYQQAEQTNGFPVVPVTQNIIAHLPKQQSGGFGSSWRAGTTNTKLIQPSDQLTISIFENTSTPLMSPEGGVTVLENTQIDTEGNIFIPYAGTIKAAGETPEALRLAIENALATKARDPQVTVARAPGEDLHVAVVGSVGRQGSVKLTPATLTLSHVLAQAGGVSTPSENTLVRVTRGRKTGWAYLDQIFKIPSQDIALRSGDRILVEADNRKVTVIGETGRQQQVPFNEPGMNVMDALANAGGLETTRADPTGIFVFRMEQPGVLKAVAPTHSANHTGVIYQIDMTQASGLFMANTMPIQDNDVIYVTQSPVAQWNKMISTIRGTAATAAALQ